MSLNRRTTAAQATNAWAAQATTDAYADLGDAWDVSAVLTKTIVVRETGSTNDVNYKILASVDGTNFVEVVAEQTLSAGTVASHAVNDYWTDVKVQVKAAVGGSQGTVAAEGAGVAA